MSDRLKAEQLECGELFLGFAMRAFFDGRLRVLSGRELRGAPVARAVDRLGELRRPDCSPPEPERGA